jgi:hypothetical protein
MNGTERKRAWRAANPERSREYEASRSRARNSGYWKYEPGNVVKCDSSDSYWRYEWGWARAKARIRARIAANTGRLAELHTEMLADIERASKLTPEELKAENARLFSDPISLFSDYR